MHRYSGESKYLGTLTAKFACMSVGCGELRSGVESGTEPRSSENRGESADHPRRPGHRLVTVVCHLPVHPRSNRKERGTSDTRLWRHPVSQLR